jgi:hypothetical protein
MGDEAAAAQHGAVDVGGIDAQMFDHRHGPHAGGDAAGGKAVDVLHGQAGIGHGRVGSTYQQRHIVHAGASPQP